MKARLLVSRMAIVLLAVIVLSPITCLGGWSDLTAEELKAKLDSGQKMLLVNSLSDIEFNESHIPGSVSIPLHTIMSSKELPADKDTLIVTYCLSKK